MNTHKMATGKNIIESEEVFYIYCSLCSENGVKKEVEKYCVDCGSYICGTCLQYHEQFPALRSHRLVDKSHGGTKTVTGAQTERCSIHPGHCVDRFCKDHDEICCEACKTIKHRSCKNVTSLTEVASGFKGSKEHKDTLEGLHSIVKTINQEKEHRNKLLSSLDEKKGSILLNIEEFQNKLTTRIQKLAEVSRKEVISRHTEQAKTVQSDVKELETVLSVAEDSVKKVSESGINEEQLFVNVMSVKSIIKDVGAMVADIPHKMTPNELLYCFEKRKLEDTVTSMKSLGYFNDSHFHATKYTSINVNSVDVTAICMFADGTFAFVDYSNGTLTRLTDKYAVRDTVSLAGSPIALCVTGSQEVAVGLREQKKIQFVACNKTLSLSNSFTITLVCTGLCYDTICDHFYVCQGGKAFRSTSAYLSVYKKDGTLLKTYENDDTGSRIFSSPNLITIDSNSIFIADRDNGLIALNKDGKRLWTFEDKKLKGAWGVCLLTDGTMLVTGFDSHNVLQISADGKEICEFLGSSAGIKRPYSLAIDKWNSRILLGCQSSVISVYTLSR